MGPKRFNPNHYCHCHLRAVISSEVFFYSTWCFREDQRDNMKLHSYILLYVQLFYNLFAIYLQLNAIMCFCLKFDYCLYECVTSKTLVWEGTEEESSYSFPCCTLLLGQQSYICSLLWNSLFVTSFISASPTGPLACDRGSISICVYI